jgi:hypothetical protein
MSREAYFFDQELSSTLQTESLGGGATPSLLPESMNRQTTMGSHSDVTIGKSKSADVLASDVNAIRSDLKRECIWAYGIEGAPDVRQVLCT